MFALVDSHVHLDDSALDADRGEVIVRARHAGVNTMIVPAGDAASWSRITALCAQHPSSVFASFGMHPLFLHQHAPAHVDALYSWLDGNEAVAIGEIGLDFHVDDLD